MSPEAKLAQYAERIHLQDEDVDYLLALVQEARGLGSVAGAAREREKCADWIEEAAREWREEAQIVAAEVAEDLARCLRKRG